MGLKTKKAGKRRTAQQPIQSDGAPVTRHLHEEIKHRAYEIYLSQGATDGHDLEDWLQAERDLREASGRAAAE